jgi:hypothetical protein
MRRRVSGVCRKYKKTPQSIAGFFLSSEQIAGRMMVKATLETAGDRASSVATGTAIGAQANPCARAAVRRAYHSRCAVRRLLARHINVHCLVVGQGVLRDDLLLRAVSPLLGDTLRDSLRRLLALANGLHASRRLSGAGRNGNGQSDKR